MINVLLMLLAMSALLLLGVTLGVYYLTTDLKDSRANVIECQSRLDSAWAEIRLGEPDRLRLEELELAVRDQTDWIIKTEDEVFDCLESKTVPLTDKLCTLRCGCYSAMMVENTWGLQE